MRQFKLSTRPIAHPKGTRQTLLLSTREPLSVSRTYVRLPSRLETNTGRLRARQNFADKHLVPSTWHQPFPDVAAHAVVDALLLGVTVHAREKISHG